MQDHRKGNASCAGLARQLALTFSVCGPGPRPAREGSIILQEPLDVIEFDLRAVGVGQAPAQLFEDAADALDVDLAGDLDRVVVAEFAAVQRTAERIRLIAAALLAASTVAGAVLLAVTVARSTSMSLTATLAPQSDNPCAIALPIPRPAPVTNATLPASFVISSLLQKGQTLRG